MDVKIKDRKEEIEFLRIACNMAEIGIEYQHADLIIRLQERLNKLKGKFSISDSTEIHHKWKADWEKYFDELSNKETTPEELPTKKTLVKDWVKTLPNMVGYGRLKRILIERFSDQYVEDITIKALTTKFGAGKGTIALFIQHRGY